MQNEPPKPFAERGTIQKACRQVDLILQNHGFEDGSVIHREYRRRDIPWNFKAALDALSSKFLPQRWRRVAVSASLHSGDVLEFVGDDSETHLNMKYLHVKFDISSQTPRIIFRMVLGEHKTAYVSVFGPCLAVTTGTKSIHLHTSAPEPGHQIVLQERFLGTTRIRNNGQWAAWEQAQALTCMTMLFQKEEDTTEPKSEKDATSDAMHMNLRAIIQGDITKTVLDDLVAKFTDPAKRGSLRPQHAFLAMFWGGLINELRLFFPHIHREGAQRWMESFEIRRFGEYMTRVMQLAASQGNFYWYSLQQKGLISDHKFAFHDLYAPRWMATAWSSRAADECKKVQWTSFTDTPCLMSAEEYRFQLRLCVARLHYCEAKLTTHGLASSQDRCPYLALFIPNPILQTSYLVFIFTGTSTGATVSPTVPRIGQELNMDIIRPFVQVEHARVIADHWQTAADFVVCCKGPAGLGDSRGSTSILLECAKNVLNKSPFFTALHKLDMQPAQLDGYNSAQLLFGHPRPPAAQPGTYLGVIRQSGQLDAMVAALLDARFNLTARQVSAA